MYSVVSFLSQRSQNKLHVIRPIVYYRSIPATFEISDLQGRLLSDGRFLSEGAYFRVVIFSIGQVLTTTVHFAQRFKVLFYFD